MVTPSVERRPSLASTVPFHTALFALYPVVRMYAENRYEVPVGDVVVPLLIIEVVALGALVLLTWLLHDATRAGIVVSAGVVVVLMFGLLMELLEPVIQDALVVMVAVGAALVLGAWYFSRRIGPRLGEVTLLLNFVALTLVVLAAAAAADGVAAEFSSADRAQAQGTVGTTEGRAPARDIYHIVLDRYGSEIALEARFGIDNSEFVGWLRDQGFDVVDDASANYTKTLMSLASTLGMHPLDDIVESQGPESENLKPLSARIRRNPAGAFLREAGYEYVHLGSWFLGSQRSDIADRSYYLEGADLSFGSLMYETSILPFLPLPSPAVTNESKHADNARYQWHVLESLVDDPGPKYVFAHVLLPHEPYVFLEDGSYDPDRATYETQLRYTNKRLRSLIGSLLDRPADERPIIVLQADEGPYPPGYDGRQKTWDWTTATDAEVLSKFEILNAMYLPGPEGEPPLRRNLSAVNTYPELLRRYFGVDIADRPDRVLASNSARPYDLYDLTDRIDALEAALASKAEGAE